MIPDKQALEFFLYGRKDCQLCDEMKGELDDLMSGCQYSCHMIDIDSDPVLQHRYGARIPVLQLANEELCEIRLDKDKVRARLDTYISQ